MVSIEAKFFTNDDIAEPAIDWTSEPGLIEVERTDEDEVAVHFRHVDDESATISGYMTKAQALGLAHALTRSALASSVAAALGQEGSQ